MKYLRVIYQDERKPTEATPSRMVVQRELDYLVANNPNQFSFILSDRLGTQQIFNSLFTWDTTPQGHKFWLNAARVYKVEVCEFVDEHLFNPEARAIAI